MVRKTLNIQIPSGGLNTELTDLTDAPMYSKDELNMDILSDGTRARRLGLEYERGYRLSKVSLAESIESESGQITKLDKAVSCYEWTNYKGDGQSLVVVQLGGKICFFKGINNGILSGEEIDYQIDLKQYAVRGYIALKGWTVTADATTYTMYTDTTTPIVGTKVYRDESMETVYSTVSSISGSTYTLANGTTMVRYSDGDCYNLPNDYMRASVSFASAYGTLFAASPYIEVIKIKLKETYTYTVSVPARAVISLSSFSSTGVNEAWVSPPCTVVITLKDGTSSSINLETYGLSVGQGWGSTTALVTAFNSVPSVVRLGFVASGDGRKTYTFVAPTGQQYNDATISLHCSVSSYGSGKWWGPNGVKGYYQRTASGVVSGAKTNNVTVQGYTEASVVTPMVRDTSGIEEPGHPGNDIMPQTLTDQHLYNLLNQGWDGNASTGKIKEFHDSQNVYPSNALTWYVLKDAAGAFAPSTVTNHAFGTSLAPRGKFILNGYSLNRADLSGVSSIAGSPYGRHRPEDITFFAGRIWYALDGRVLYSQIISEDATLAEKCYQAADPTSEDVSDPVDTDGGVMNIQQCGKILRIVTLGTALLVFGDKGVVAILPSVNTGFTPTTYYQQVVSSVGTISKRAVLSVGNAVYYWSSLGIHMVSFNENGQLSSNNISFGVIHTFFKNLAPISLENCVAKFNAIKGDICFMYPTHEDQPKRLDGFLKYNISTNTWTPRDVPLTEISSPFIIDAVEVRNPINTKPKAVVEANGATVLTGTDVVEITKEKEDYVGYDTLSYAVVDGDSMCLTFANCTNIEHKDWAIGDVVGNGYNYNSYLTTHPYVFNDIYMNKQAPYVTTTFKRTEEGGLFQSGCFMSSRWDWSLSQDSYKWDIGQQIYRLGEQYKYKEYVMSKTRVRGSGKSMQLHFKSDGSKDFHLCAIGVDARGWNK